MFTWLTSKLLGPFLPYLIGGGLLLTIASIGYFYYNDTQGKLAELNRQLSVQQVKIAEQQTTIKFMNDSLIVRNQTQEEIFKKFKDARKQIDDLNSKLLDQNGQELDLNKMLTDHPEVMEKIINNGTKRAYDCFSLYSGSDINQVEPDKKKQQKLLKECGL